MKRVAETERDTIVEIPAIIGLRPVIVEPQLAVVIAFDVEHVRVAVGVRIVRRVICTTIHRILSGLNRMRDRKSHNTAHQVSSFFSFACTTLSQTVAGDILNAWILDSAAGNLGHLHIRLLPFSIISKSFSPRREARRGLDRTKAKGAKGKRQAAEAEDNLRRRNEIR